MRTIYEPSGRAREYNPLACNLFTGCRHRCKYCYCPGILRQTVEQWSANPQPRAGVLADLAHAAKAYRGDPREVLFCFMSDPYQTPEAVALTGEALAICERNTVKATVLTKAGTAAAVHFPLLARAGYRFGSTVCFLSESMRQEWEPGAAPIADRLAAIRAARAAGVKTWVSVEPVIDAAEGLAAIRALLPICDTIKVGKLNHVPAVEARTDWPAFARAAAALLAGHDHVIKDDLKRYL